MTRAYLAEGGGGSKEIVMNLNEMQEIMRLMTTIEVSFHTVLAPKLQTLSKTKYYEGGEASKFLKHYEDILNKVNEVGDLYSRANSEVFKLIGQWMEQDAILAKSFYDSLDPNGQLAKNLNILSGGASQ